MLAVLSETPDETADVDRCRHMGVALEVQLRIERCTVDGVEARFGVRDPFVDPGEQPIEGHPPFGVVADLPEARHVMGGVPPVDASHNHVWLSVGPWVGDDDRHLGGIGELAEAGGDRSDEGAAIGTDCLESGGQEFLDELVEPFGIERGRGPVSHDRSRVLRWFLGPDWLGSRRRRA